MSPRERPIREESDSDESSKSRSDKKVSFGSIEIREYNRIVGDHPDVRVGVPIGISWEYAVHEPLPVDEYEENRPTRRKNLRLSSFTRRKLLQREFLVDEQEIIAAEKEVEKIKRLRERSNNQSKTVATVESALQSTKRKIFRRFSKENLFAGFVEASGSMIPLGMQA